MRQAQQQDMEFKPHESSRAGLGAWLRAWGECLADPDKEMPDPGLPGEGVPLPEDLHLRCPECGHDLGGLTQWCCPGCSRRFSPRRAYTLRMLRRPEYALRYRYDPRELRMVFWGLVLLLGGLIRAAFAGTFGMVFGGGMLVFFGIIIVPNLLLLKLQGAFSWPRLFFWVTLLWFIGAMALLW